ncbi:MAG: hypothetical protein ACR2PQ_10405, partial [Myxococcota bacterium]
EVQRDARVTLQPADQFVDHAELDVGHSTDLLHRLAGGRTARQSMSRHVVDCPFLRPGFRGATPIGVIAQ